MNDIPFGKFYDTQTNKEFISAFEEVKRNDDAEDTHYLLRNTLENCYFVVVGYGNGGADWDSFYAWVGQQFQERNYELQEIGIERSSRKIYRI